MDRARRIAVRAIAPETLLGPLNAVERVRAPDRLYVAGDESLLQRGRRVSVIGSRQASADSIRRARKFAKALVERDVTVVSGLAAGIDSAAHAAAIGLGGRTVAVLGTPVDVAYPRTNAGLHRAIIRDHVAVSQFPPGSPIRPRNFPMRNRTMALLSHATVIVTAGERSGTEHQGWEALRLGRDLLFLKSLATSGMGWIERQLERGAQVLDDGSLDRWLATLLERAGDAESVL